MKIDPRLFEYYESLFVEQDRLSTREGQLELVRTKELLSRYLPKTSAKIIDIGGGTGIYAEWLASLGHQVHLIDIMPDHVDQALSKGTFTTAVGDARSLLVSDGEYDVALLLGPLYHLRDQKDRLKAIEEAHRVVCSGGLVIAAFITRGAVALDGYVKGWLDNPDASQMMQDIIKDGLHNSDRSGFSVTACFHLPDDARSELIDAGLEVLSIFGIEGPGWIASDFEERWSSPEGRKIILESARACESEPQLQALSGHLLAVTQKS